MDAFFGHAKNRIKSHLFRRPRASKQSSLWKVAIGCLGVFYASISYLIGPSYIILAVFFLGLMLVAGGAAADLAYAETSSGGNRAALLRAAALLCSIPFVALVITDILTTYVLS